MERILPLGSVFARDGGPTARHRCALQLADSKTRPQLVVAEAADVLEQAGLVRVEWLLEGVFDRLVRDPERQEVSIRRVVVPVEEAANSVHILKKLLLASYASMDE